MVRIALWGGAGLDNIGDRLLMSVAEAELGRRIPDAVFDRFCPWSDGGADAALPLWIDSEGRWPGTGRYDAVTVLGGVWAGPPFRIALMQVFCLGDAPALFDPGVHVAWHGVGQVDDAVAADRSPWRAYLSEVAGRLDRITVRSEEAAKAFARDSGQLPRVVPDPAFALPPLPVRAAGRRAGTRMRIGVALGGAGASARLRQVLTDPRYFGRVRWNPATCSTPQEIEADHARPSEAARRAGFLDALWPALRALSRSAQVEFLSVRNMYADDEVAAAGVAAVPGSVLREVSPADADTLTGVLAEYDTVLVSRFHSVVLALRAGVPVVAADPYWSGRTRTSKVHQLMAGLGLGDRYWTYDPDRGGVPGELAAVLAAACADGPRAAEAYGSAHRDAQVEFDLLSGAIQEKMGRGDRLAAR